MNKPIRFLRISAWLLVVLMIMGSVLHIEVGIVYASPAKSQDLPPIYSPIPGDKDLASYINYNGGFHSHGEGNNGGIDIYYEGRNVYLPFTACRLWYGIDYSTGTGGLGVAAIEGELKFLIWHLESVDEEFKSKVDAEECVQAMTLVGRLGGSVNEGQIVSTFAQMPGYEMVPEHGHTSIGKETPWNNGCSEEYARGYWWGDPTCIVQKWHLDGTPVAQASINGIVSSTENEEKGSGSNIYGGNTQQNIDYSNESQNTAYSTAKFVYPDIEVAEDHTILINGEEMIKLDTPAPVKRSLIKEIIGFAQYAPLEFIIGIGLILGLIAIWIFLCIAITPKKGPRTYRVRK